MPRRRRTNFKPKKTVKSHGGDPEAPSETEWRQMTEFGSFVVRDEDDVEHTFRKGDAATILPHRAVVGEDIELHRYWVGRIKEIRARNGDEVWARVQWYWSGHEIAETIKSFDESSCGQYERALSDHFDLVSSSAFDAVVTVKELVEDDIDQPHISRSEFYTRYTFEYKARTIEPKPGERTCLCNNPYSPDDVSALMHFCPRPSCRRAYHQKCLLSAKSKDPDSITTRPYRLMTSSPDSDQTAILEDLVSRPPKKRRRGRPAQGEQSSRDRLEHLLEELPPELVSVAQQPIVRGAAFALGGVSGNVQAVVRARRLIYEALAGRTALNGWEDNINVSRSIVKILGRKIAPALICPECKGPI